MLVMSDTRRGALGDTPAAGACASLDWDPYCDCQFANDEANRVKCKEKPWNCCPLGICPPGASPNSDYGAGCRLIPRPGAGTAYTIANVLSTIDIGSQVINQIQAGDIKKNEAITAQNQADQAASDAAAQQAAVQRAAILKVVKYGAYVAGGLLVLVVAKKALRPRAQAPAQVSSYTRRIRRRAA